MEDPDFFDTTPVEVGQQVALCYGGHEWKITQILEIDEKRQRICCEAGRYSVEPGRFWYDKHGNVLSQKTGRPLKRDWLYGHLYPLTHEIRATIRLSAKRHQLNYIGSHRMYLAIHQDWHGQTEEARLDFIIARFNQALADLPQALGENGQEEFYTVPLKLQDPLGILTSH